MGTAIKHMCQTGLSRHYFVIFDVRALTSECPDVKNYKWRLNPRSGTGCFIAVPIYGNSRRKRDNFGHILPSTFVRQKPFLADRTNGRAYATVLRLSSSSVTLCTVAKRCVLEQKLLLRAYIGSRIWEIDWYQNQWPWPLFRGHIKVTSTIALH